MIVLDEMPAWVEERHHDLNLMARECYQLRNEAPNESAAELFHAAGDVHLLAALALTEEWYPL